MNEQLVATLVQDLTRSGFYSEMRAIHACRTARWECRGSFTYFDKDERTTRECDFEAVREWVKLRNDGSTVHVVARLLGQVKKSEKPWIVFVDREPALSRMKDGSDNIIVSNADPDSIGNLLRRHSLIGRNGWTGTGIHEAFKKPTDTSRWYAAFVSVCKAAESAFDVTASRSDDGIHFHLIKPVVILDGAVIAAALSPDGELLLTRAEDAAFVFEYRSDAYERPRYYLDLVTLDALPRYLDAVATGMAAVAEALRR